MATLEQRTSESWLARAYKQEGKMIWNYLASAAISLGGTTMYAAYATGSPAEVASATGAVDVGLFLGTFIPQLAYRDRAYLRNKEGGLDARHVLKKAGEYVSLLGIANTAYFAIRSIIQYKLQKEGFDPASASLSIQLASLAFGALVLPPLKFAMDRVFCRNGKRATVTLDSPA